jgi:hypothetical protein
VDRFISAYEAVEDGDLMLCHGHGVAYQKDREHQVAYDEEYYSKCASYEDQAIALAINAGRIALVNKHFGIGRVVDIGIGSGEFIKKRPNTFGLDINPVAIEWLKRNDKWADKLEYFGAFTFWDVLEHVETPEAYLRYVGLHSFVFVSLPLFTDLADIKQSKHYRPGEHLYYWCGEGFVRWMRAHGFMMLDVQTFEIAAGRESIYSFAFKRYRWPEAPCK